MKIYNMELVRIANTLEDYATKKLPQKISYAITKNMLILAGDIDAYNKALQKIITSFDEYIAKDENGQYVMGSNGLPEVDDAHKEAYYSEINDLLKIQIDVNLFSIEEEDFNYADSDRYDAMSPKDIIVLREILCNDKEEKE